MFITYLKQTGELVPPIMTSDIPLTLEDVLGEEKGKIYGVIYDYINIIDIPEIFDNTNKFYVDIETKELRRKPEVDLTSIKYL